MGSCLGWDAVLVWVLPEVDAEIRIPLQVVDLGGGSRRHRKGSQIGT